MCKMAFLRILFIHCYLRREFARLPDLEYILPMH